MLSFLQERAQVVKCVQDFKNKMGVVNTTHRSNEFIAKAQSKIVNETFIFFSTFKIVLKIKQRTFFLIWCLWTKNKCCLDNTFKETSRFFTFDFLS